ncbi:hypothetical protein N7463_010548 [Penicillium fimorum]|uniref:Uncharacterized protein n=1 Tax=Penicillium fimorum TaxID=1882269 RepID=A0A9W9XK36_9EURO|nr:hypothetical protein N7463_010548 [Penicillium fimorum]
MPTRGAKCKEYDNADLGSIRADHLRDEEEWILYALAPNVLHGLNLLETCTQPCAKTGHFAQKRRHFLDSQCLG